MLATITKENTKSFPQHKHSVHEIMHYIEGQGILRTEVGDIPFEPEVVVIMPPGIMHGSISDEPFKNICLHIALELPDLKQPLIMSKESEAGILLDLICRLVMSDRKKNATVINHLLKAEEEIIRDEVAIADDNFAAAARMVHREILDHFTEEEFDLASIISNTHYSDDYFRARYKETYNTTPYAYLINLRINYAADLLKVYGKNLAIKEIARQSGFKDPMYFSRIFTKRKGCSPKKFVNQMRHC